MKILVTGGSGVIGRATVADLLRRGYQVRLLSRHAEQAIETWTHDVEAFAGNVADPASIRGAADDCSVVIHIVGIAEESPPQATFQRVNIDGTRHILAEAERAQVERFIHVSSLGADRGASEYHRSKLAAEELVRASPLDWLIIRPGNVFGPGDEAVSLLLRMVRVLPAIPIVNRGDQPFQPVWHEDLGWALAECVDRTDLSRQILELAGAETTTVNDLIDEFSAITGRNPARLPVPGPLASLATKVASALGLKTAVKPATITMLLEGNVIRPGRQNALTDVLGREPEPIRERLLQLADGLPEQMPEEGVGPLQRRRFRISIHGSRYSAAELFEMLGRRLDDFVGFDAEAEPRSGSRLEVGATINIELPPRGHAQVRVEEMADGIITLGTLAGHPLAGVVRLRLDEPDEGVVRFTIDVAERAATRVDQVSMALIGRSTQTRAWHRTAERVLHASGGTSPDGVQEESWEVDEDRADRIEDWIRERIHTRLRTEQEDES